MKSNVIIVYEENNNNRVELRLKWLLLIDSPILFPNISAIQIYGEFKNYPGILTRVENDEQNKVILFKVLVIMYTKILNRSIT